MTISKTILNSLAAAALAIGALALSGSHSPAEAAGCYYKAFNPNGHYLNIRGVGHAAKKSWACNRARRECNRRLTRALKSGQIVTNSSRGYQCKKTG